MREGELPSRDRILRVNAEKNYRTESAQRLAATEKFLREHPSPTADEVIGFLKNSGVDLREDADWNVRHLPQWRLIAALTTNLHERHLLCEYDQRMLTRRYREQLRDTAKKQELEPGKKSDLRQSADAMNEERERVYTIVLARYAERVIGMRRAAGLLETMRSHYGEIANAEASFDREALAEEVGMRANSFTDATAREAFAGAFGMDFETYDETFPRT